MATTTVAAATSSFIGTRLNEAHSGSGRVQARFGFGTKKAPPKKVSKSVTADRPLWFPGAQAPEWLDGSLVGDYGFDPFGLGKPAEYLQYDLDSLDQNLAKNLAGEIIGTRTEAADVKSTPFQPYSEVFGLQRFRECELIHGRWAMLATLGALTVEWLTGVTWQDAGKVPEDHVRAHQQSSRSETASKLEGKIALITGAASGIGKETAKKFINNGAKVVIADIQTKLGKETATELGTHASFISCDVSKESDIAHAVDYAVSNYGQLDIMFNNAGIACHTPPTIVDLDLAAFDRVMSINVRGVVAGIKHASRVMIPQGHGSILCTSSITGVLGGLAQHTYSISKSTVVGVMKSAAAELCRYGIRINCISPFAIPTPFVIEEMRVYFPGFDDQGLAKMIHDNGVLRGAICEPEDIANAALYLASDDAKYVSGHNLVVDGGFTSIKNLSFPVSNEFESEE